jgi:hypothetical protein
MLIDAAWFAAIILGIRRGLGWQPLIIWLAVIAVWVVANRYDAYRN